MLSRSNTWPVVVVRLADGRPATQLEPPVPLPEHKTEVAEPPRPQRKATTLYRHYYLEGGWGWVVVCVSVCVHLLNHGLQLSWVILLVPTAGKFKTSALDTG